MMILFIEQDYREWDKYLSEFRFAYNTAFHFSLETFPAFLNLGSELEPTQSLSRSCSQMTTEVETGNIASWSERMNKLRFLREWIILDW